MNTISKQWPLPTHQDNITLLPHEVHVWRAPLTVSASLIQHFQQLLSPDELARANRYHFERDHNRFIVARGILRTLLGRYLDIDPVRVGFSFNAYGKPLLETPHDSLHFNLSHSHELALFAFAHHRYVGVDVEFMERDIAFDELARHTFSANEAATIAALSGDAKRQGFFNCWTRKEAYIKARGMGVSLGLTQFDVSLKPDEPARLLQSRENPHEVTRWQFENLSVSPGYAAALVAEGHDWQLRTWQW